MIKLEGFRVGDTIHLDPFAIPQLKIITKEEADEIASRYPQHEFVVTVPKSFEFKSFVDYVRRHKR